MLALLLALSMVSVGTLAEMAPPVVNDVKPKFAAKLPNYPVRHELKRAEILAMEAQYASRIFNDREPIFQTQPSLTAPYAADSIVQADLDDGLRALKMVRYLAGVSHQDVRLSNQDNAGGA